jgi:hypothetical protein
MKIKFFFLLAMLCCMSNRASATLGCIHPSFSIYNNFTATTIVSNGAPTSVAISSTVTVSGYTIIDPACAQVMTNTVQHWIALTNRITPTGGTPIGGIYNSPRVCPACTINFSQGIGTETDPVTGQVFVEGDWNAFCSSAGNFGGGGGGGQGFLGKFVRTLKAAEIPDPTRTKINCQTGTFLPNITICDVPVKPWCMTGVTPAVTPPYVRAQVNPQAKWWISYDECARITSTNTAPWICPDLPTAVPYGDLNIPIGLPFSFDQYTTPPLGGYPSCDSIWKP